MTQIIRTSFVTAPGLALTLILISFAFAASAQDDITPFSSFLSAKDGDPVFFTARVEGFRESWSANAPNTITITDGSQTLPLVYWSNMAANIPEESKQKGAIIEVKGEMHEFQGKPQIKVTKNGSYVKLLKAGAPEAARAPVDDSSMVNYSSAANAPLTAISSIKPPDLGQIVTIEGRVNDYTASWAERAPNKLTVNDGTGSISVVYWKDVADQLTQTPRPGDTLQVTGESQEYRGEIQLKVRNARLMTIKEGSYTPPAQPKIAAPAPASSSTPNRAPVITKGPNSPEVRWELGYGAAMENARRQGKPMIIYFRNNGIDRCVDLEVQVLMSDDFNNRAQGFSCVFEDVSQGLQLAYHFNVIRIPHIEVLNANGDSVARLTANFSAQELYTAMEKARTGAN